MLQLALETLRATLSMEAVARRAAEDRIAELEAQLARRKRLAEVRNWLLTVALGDEDWVRAKCVYYMFRQFAWH